MEAVAAITVISDGIALCSKAIIELKKFVHADKSLKALIQHVERIRQSSDLLSMLISEMRNAGYADFTLPLGPCAQRLRSLIDNIIARASEIAAGQPYLGFTRRIKWTLGSSKTKELVNELTEVEKVIRHNVGLLTLWASVRNISVTQRVDKGEPELHDAFSSITLIGDQDEEEKAQPELLRTWLGHATSENHDQKYLEYRAALTDAAKYGRWGEVFSLIDLGRSLYKESWVNATRIKPRSQSDNVALWTPLHQAVYMQAPLHIVEKLVQLGASRTLRTRWTEFTWTNMTALELALELDVPWDMSILRPVIHKPVPANSLQRLEEKFHAIIRHELGDSFERLRLYLPVLEALTEFDSGPTWFPVALGDKGSHGYMYQLDSRHLLVWSINIDPQDSDAKYRITEEEIFRVGEALVFG